MVERYRSEDRARACAEAAGLQGDRHSFPAPQGHDERGERGPGADPGRVHHARHDLAARGTNVDRPAGPRTIFRPVPLDHRDGAFALVVLAAVGAVLLLAWRAGWLAGWGALGVFG